MRRYFSNPTLLAALRLLAHPISLAALALLLANDLLFRRFWPSWWTGKLGDAAWLVFAPWLAAVLLVALTSLTKAFHPTHPSRASRSRTLPRPAAVEFRLLRLALAITGLGFGLVKTVPALHYAATRIWADILGTAPALIRDPSDLLALPALLVPLALLIKTEKGLNALSIPLFPYSLMEFNKLLPQRSISQPRPTPRAKAHGLRRRQLKLALRGPGVRVWKPASAGASDSRSSPDKPANLPIYRLAWTESLQHLFVNVHKGKAWQHKPRSTQSSSLRPWLVLPLAALVLLGDAAAPDLGFQCFEARDGRIYANAGYNAYVSDDGGQSWQMEESGRANCDSQPALLEGDSWVTVDGPSTIDYRYRPGEVIQTSDDGGQSWQTAMQLTGISEPEQFYILKTREGNPVYEPGPLDAIADPQTGSMIFAMGQQGVLVHTSTGEWVWAMGGAYQRAQNFPDSTAFAALLGPVIYMALALALLIYATLALGRTGGWLRAVVLIAAWLAWLLVALIFPPPSSYGYSELFTVLGVLAAGALAIILVVEQTFKLARTRSRGAPVDFLRMALVSLGGGLLFFVPYLMWLYGALPSLNIANIAGLVIAFAALGAGFALTRKAKTQP